jgi:hypothetical protein
MPAQLTTVSLTDAEEVEMLSALRNMKQIVTEAGEDYVYRARLETPVGKACVYLWEGIPDCLVGRILSRMGVSMKTLSDMGTIGIGAAAVSHLTLSRYTVDVLAFAQQYQDSKYTWGQCLDFALKYANERYGVTV